MKRLSTILAIILSIMTGCGEGNKQSTNDFITIDVTASYPKKELVLQDFMDVEYIPLETNGEFIAMAYIQSIDKNVLIVRNSNHSSDGDIFFFNIKNGNGLGKINRLGRNPEEYRFLSGVTLDESNREIFVNDNSTKKIFVYDLFGNFKRSFAHKKGTAYNQIYNFDRDNLICHDGDSSFDEEKRSIFWIISKQDGSIVREMQIAYQEIISTILTLTDAKGATISSSGANNLELIPYYDSWLLVEPSSDIIYRFQSDYSMVPFIVRTPSIQSMDTEVFLFPGVLTDRYYFMQTVKKEYDFETETGFPRTDLMYDKQENAIFEYVVYNDDFSDKGPIDLVYEVTLLNNELTFVQSINAFELVKAYEEGKLKGRLKEIAANLNKESNPVLLLAKYKKQEIIP